MKKLLFILVIFSLGFAPCKKKIVQAFEALSIYDYFKAKILFEKSLKKHEVAASYGLSQIFYEERNHFFNLDSSRVQINRSKEIVNTYDEKEIKRLGDLGITKASLDAHYETVALKAYRYALDTASIEAYNRIILKYPESSIVSETTMRRDSMAFKLAQSENTAVSFKQFIENYPLAEQRFKAMELYEQRKFDQISSKGTEEDLSKFILNNPDSPFLSNAQDELYELYEIKDELEGYISFIQKYPGNPNINFAYRNILQLELYDFSDIGINRFINRFPNSPIQNEVNELKSIIEMGVIQFEHNETSWVLDHLGNYLFLKPEGLGQMTEGLFPYVQNGKTGFYDHKGRIAIDPIYTDAFSFHRGLAVVENQGLFGVIDRRGRPIIPVKYEELSEFSEGVIQAFDGEQYLFFDRKGELVLKSKLKPIGDFENGYLVVKQDQQYGIVNRDGEFVIIPEYDWIENFDGNFARFKLDGLYGLLKIDGSRVLENHFDFISKESNGKRLVEFDNRVNYFENEVISNLDFEIHDRKQATFKDGFAVVKQKGKYGIIDSLYQKILPSGYQGISNLGNGLFIIKDRNKFKLFDALSGKMNKTLYDKVEAIDKSRIIVVKENESALLNREEGILIPYHSGSLEFMNGFITRTNEAQKKALYDLDGNEIVTAEYDEIVGLDTEKFLLLKGQTAEVYDANKNEIIFEKM